MLTLPDKRSFLPAVTLMLITPVLTELLSGNVPAPIFFLPKTGVLLILTYGLPALLLRELYVAWKLTLPGLFLLGLAYGIFNEGVLAKTLLRSERVPIGTFDHYTWLGVNFPWAALIVPWHAFHAIIFPIALVTWWFPSAARTSWLSARLFQFISFLLIVTGALVHLTDKKLPTSPVYLVFFAAIMAALIFLSKRTGRKDPFLETDAPGTLLAAAAGFSFYPVLVVGISFCAGLKLPGIVICLAAILILALYYRLLLRKGWLSLTPFVLFALGDYLAGALLTGCIHLKSSLASVVTEGILAVFFGLGILAILRTNRARN